MMTTTCLGLSDKDLGVNYPDAIVYGGVTVSLGGAQDAAKGDVDGDGVPDLIFTGRLDIGAPQTRKYVAVFFDATLASIHNKNFSNADFMIIAQKPYPCPWTSDILKHHPKYQVAVADLNQDGFDDILFGLPTTQTAEGVPEEKGEAYIVLGNTKSELGTLRDFSVDPPDFTFFGGDDGDRAGWSVAAGDVNGDGQKDILIGAPLADGPSNAFTDGGEIYAITQMDWGQSSMVLTEPNVDLFLYGNTGEQYGYAMIAANLNGDTSGAGNPIDDVIVAPKEGPVKMVFGGVSGSIPLSNADWTSVYNFSPRHPNLATGDLNNDQIDELIAGEADTYLYIHYGSQANISTDADVRIRSCVVSCDKHMGFSNFVADFDGDGYKDLATLAPWGRGKNNEYSIDVGQAHIIWGQSARLPSLITLETDSSDFTLYGSDGTGPTGLLSNFQGPWNSDYGYVFGMELEGSGINAELFFGDPTNTYIYKIGPRSTGPHRKCTCFLAGTPILMADGSQIPIEKVKVGDKVLAFDEATKTLKEDSVKEFVEHTADEYFVINDRLRLTEEHPVYSEGKWVEAGRLKVGDKLLNSDGKSESITSIQKVKENAKVYNLEVNPYHTYVAGGVVVHNKAKLICQEYMPR
ncbi:MAG: polymorphic toxin-type HINT domain-containing protein [Candidatus Omnitrophota bacterium]